MDFRYRDYGEVMKQSLVVVDNSFDARDTACDTDVQIQGMNEASQIKSIVTRSKPTTQLDCNSV